MHVGRRSPTMLAFGWKLPCESAPWTVASPPSSSSTAVSHVSSTTTTVVASAPAGVVSAAASSPSPSPSSSSSSSDGNRGSNYRVPVFVPNAPSLSENEINFMCSVAARLPPQFGMHANSARLLLLDKRDVRGEKSARMAALDVELLRYIAHRILTQLRICIDACSDPVVERPRTPLHAYMIDKKDRTFLAFAVISDLHWFCRDRIVAAHHWSGTLTAPLRFMASLSTVMSPVSVAAATSGDECVPEILFADALCVDPDDVASTVHVKNLRHLALRGWLGVMRVLNDIPMEHLIPAGSSWPARHTAPEAKTVPAFPPGFKRFVKENPRAGASTDSSISRQMDKCVAFSVGFCAYGACCRLAHVPPRTAAPAKPLPKTPTWSVGSFASAGRRLYPRGRVRNYAAAAAASARRPPAHELAASRQRQRQYRNQRGRQLRGAHRRWRRRHRRVPRESAS